MHSMTHLRHNNRPWEIKQSVSKTVLNIGSNTSITILSFFQSQSAQIGQIFCLSRVLWHGWPKTGHLQTISPSSWQDLSQFCKSTKIVSGSIRLWKNNTGTSLRGVFDFIPLRKRNIKLGLVAAVSCFYVKSSSEQKNKQTTGCCT